MREELKVIRDFYDYMKWLIGHTEKFPRHHRYSLGLSIENRLQDMLELLLRARYSRDKADILHEFNLQLDVLRYQVRLATDLRAMPAKSQEHAAGCMIEIGAQVGGWIKSAKP